jgi:tRNA threonylcarbamoyl adenosine modification protein YeaZ
MSARLLVIDCATPALSIALFEDGTCLAHRHVELGRGHAEALVPAIAALPDGGRADRILVDVGPGSFTGVRVGIAAAVALGFAWSIPVQGFSCLDLVAAMVRDQHAPDAPFPVVMVGGHGELFWALYPPADDPRAASPLDVMSTPIDELAARLDDAVIYGSGAQVLIDARNGTGTAVPLLPDARSVALLSSAQSNLPTQAIYGRGADAKPMASKSAPEAIR